MRLTTTMCVLTVLSGLMSHVAQGALISDDFSYATTALNAGAKNGGTGWSAEWGNGDTNPISTVTVAGENLTYGINNGYSITQTGTGRVNGTSGTSYRLINRPLDAALSGTVWFSYLFVNGSGSSQSKVGLSFNTSVQQGSDIIQYGIMVNASSTTESSRAITESCG